MTASKDDMYSQQEAVPWEVCMKQILLPGAVAAEGDETALHFCGFECQAAAPIGCGCVSHRILSHTLHCGRR